EAPEWGVTRRRGVHEPLINFQTYLKIQERLNGRPQAPVRKDLNEDFPLRGFVVCACCQVPLTAGWSKGRSKHYAYYYCQKPGCPEYGKSVKRERLEDAFMALAKTLQPSERVARLAAHMLKDVWSQLGRQVSDQVRALETEHAKIEKSIADMLDR